MQRFQYIGFSSAIWAIYCKNRQKYFSIFISYYSIFMFRNSRSLHVECYFISNTLVIFDCKLA